MFLIKVEVHNDKTKLVGFLESKVLSRLKYELSYELPGAYWAQKVNPYAGIKHLFSPGRQSFPTGLLNKVEAILAGFNVSYEVIDCRAPVTLGEPIELKNVTLRDYQIEAMNNAIEKQRGIVKIGTGGGKTLIIAAIAGKLNVTTLILIHKTDIFYQLIDRLSSVLQVPIGKIGDGHCDIQQITVGMIQTVSRAFGAGLPKKYKQKADKDKKILQERSKDIRKFVSEVKCLLTDEAHHTPSDSFVEVYKNAINAFYRVGFSASPWREDNADLLIEAEHAPQVIDISASTLIDRGYLVPPKVFLFKFPHKTSGKKGKYAQIYDDEVVFNTSRNNLVVVLALKAASVGKSVLIAVTKIAHGKRLEELLTSIDPSAIFVSGEADTQLRQQVLRELDEHTRSIVICTTIFGEGIDCPRLDVLINAKAASSSVDAFQLIGRVLRKAPNKKRAYLVDIFDESCKYLGKHSKSRLRIYSTEPRYELIPVSSEKQVTFEETP